MIVRQILPQSPRTGVQFIVEQGQSCDVLYIGRPCPEGKSLIGLETMEQDLPVHFETHSSNVILTLGRGVAHRVSNLDLG